MLSVALDLPRNARMSAPYTHPTFDTKFDSVQTPERIEARTGAQKPMATNPRDPLPLRSDSPAQMPQIPLERAPLVRVIAQISFAQLLSIETDNLKRSAFQERIRKLFPFLQEENIENLEVQVSQTGPTVNRISQSLWRFQDHPGGAVTWRVTLAKSFVSLETWSYSSREDMLNRIEHVTAALKEVFDPGPIVRMGIRYVDRIIDDEPIDSLVCGDLMGFFAYEEHLLQAVSEATFSVTEGRLRLRWGRIPPNVVVDPDILPPIQEGSWALDLDAFNHEEVGFDERAIRAKIEDLASRCYAVFRWAVTDKFLVKYGANVS